MKKILRDQTGVTAIIVGIAFMMLLAAVGLSIDMARAYAVQSKAQNALDAAILGAVTTSNSNGDYSVQDETIRLFNANYPDQYMGATTSSITVAQAGDAANVTYTATVTLSVPNVIMSIFQQPTTQLNMLSQANKGLQTAHAPELEMALVLDNTGSMNCLADNPTGNSCPPSANSKIESLKVAAVELTNILFGNQGNLQNLHISVVPFASHVNLGAVGGNWIQQAFKPQISNYCCDALFTSLPPAGNHYVANRKADLYQDATHNDFNANPPLTDVDSFRTPYAYGLPGYCGFSDDDDYDDPYNQPFDDPDEEGNYYYYDYVCSTLAPIVFGQNNSATVINALNNMVAGGNTRINIGLMWGWFALSPKWQGIWNSGQQNLPETPNPYLTKTLVLMTDGKNKVYTATGNIPSPYADDDAATVAMCETIKSSPEHIVIYTIGYGTAETIDENLLRNCASGNDHYFLAPTDAQLQIIFKQIADDTVSNTLHLTQ